VTAFVHVCDDFIGPLQQRAGKLCVCVRVCVMSLCWSQWAVDFNRAWITITVPQRESGRQRTESSRSYPHTHIHLLCSFRGAAEIPIRTLHRKAPSSSSLPLFGFLLCSRVSILYSIGHTLYPYNIYKTEKNCVYFLYKKLSGQLPHSCHWNFFRRFVRVSWSQQ